LYTHPAHLTQRDAAPAARGGSAATCCRRAQPVTGKRHSAVHCRHAAAGRGRPCHRQAPDPGDRRSRPLRCRATYRPCRVPGQHATGISSRDHHDGQFASATSRRRSPAVPPAPPGRRSRAQGRWSVARAPV